MANISTIIDKIKNTAGAKGKAMRGWFAEGLETIESELSVNTSAIFANADNSTPWVIFNTANQTIMINANIYLVFNNKRIDINPAIYPEAISYDVSVSATKALVYDDDTALLRCISFTEVSSNHRVLFYFNGQAYQLTRPSNFSRRFPYQVDGNKYNIN